MAYTRVAAVVFLPQRMADSASWTEVGEAFPLAIVKWDADVASEGWTPIFTIPTPDEFPYLAATHPQCYRHAIGAGGVECLCRVWRGDIWLRWQEYRGMLYRYVPAGDWNEA